MFNDEKDRFRDNYKNDSEEFDENESAKLASMHENDILDEDGSIYKESDYFEDPDDNEEALV